MLAASYQSICQMAQLLNAPSSPSKNLEKFSMYKSGSSTIKTDSPVLDLARAAAAKPRKGRNLHGETMVEGDVNTNCSRSRRMSCSHRATDHVGISWGTQLRKLAVT